MTVVPAIRARARVMRRSVMMAADGRWRRRVRMVAVTRENMRLLMRMWVQMMLTGSSLMMMVHGGMRWRRRIVTLHRCIMGRIPSIAATVNSASTTAATIGRQTRAFMA